MTEWNQQREKRIVRNSFGLADASIISWLKFDHARCRLAFKFCGGSLAILIDACRCILIIIDRCLPAGILVIDACRSILAFMTH